MRRALLLLSLVLMLAGCASDGGAPQLRSRYIDAATASAVVPGMTPEQIVRLLGPPRTRVFFKLSGEDVWDWRAS